MLLLSKKLSVSPALVACMVFALALAFSCKSKVNKPLIEASLDTIEQQKFTIDASENEVVVGKAGSVFAIPSGAFLDENGKKVRGEVEIVIQEAPDLATMFHAGMQTVSDRGLLRTAGSYSIEAFKRGQPVELDPKVGIYAYFPSDDLDPEMKLYDGKIYSENVEWTLNTEKQTGIPACDKDKMTRRQCKKCERLVQMNKRINPGRAPMEADDFWSKRYYWHDGVMYFASSGSAKEVFKQKDLKDCQNYLARSEDGQELLAKVKEITETQLANIGNHYAFRLNSLGWKNCDALVKQELVAFNGKVVDEDGDPIGAAKIHLYCKELNIHVMTSSDFDGTYSFDFQPEVPFTVYAYRDDQVGKSNLQVEIGKEEVGALTLDRIKPEEMDAYLEDLI